MHIFSKGWVLEKSQSQNQIFRILLQQVKFAFEMHTVLFDM